MTRPLTETWTVLVRELMPTLREPWGLLFTLAQPLLFLFFFGPLLASSFGAFAGDAFGGTNAWQWFVPGVLVMLTLFGTAGTGYSLQVELATGSFNRLLVTPMNRSSIFAGKALKEMVPLFMQALIIVLAAIPFGFTLYPLHALFGLLLLGVFGIGLGALSNALALAARNSEWLFWSVQSTLQFPLLILSGMMLPLDFAPRWMQVAAQFNPLMYMVEAQRALFAGNFLEPAVLYGAIAAVATCVVGMLVGMRAIRRSFS